jgi:hypothetical protein
MDLLHVELPSYLVGLCVGFQLEGGKTLVSCESE